MKDKYKLDYCKCPTFLSHTYYAYVSAITDYYFFNSIRLLFQLSDPQIYNTYSEGMTYIIKKDFIEINKVDINSNCGLITFYRRASYKDCIEISVSKMFFSDPYGSVSLFVSVNELVDEINDGNDVIRFGLFSKGELFIKYNNQIIYNKIISVEYIRKLILKKDSDSLDFYCQYLNGKKENIYSLKLNNLFVIKKQYLGVHVDINHELFCDKLYFNHIQ